MHLKEAGRRVAFEEGRVAGIQAYLDPAEALDAAGLPNE